MANEDTLDINIVSKQLGVSSRTLRYYEERGLIESTKENNSKRRRYTSEQIEEIQYILTLRAIGIPIKAINEYLKGDITLKEVVNLRKAEIEALIDEKINEIRLLDYVLSSLADGRELCYRDEHNEETGVGRLAEITRKQTLNIVNGQFEHLYTFFSAKMKDYLPMEAFIKIWNDSISGLGNYLKLGETTQDVLVSNIFYQIVYFEKMTIKFKFVYHEEVISGLWFNYIGKS